ncbi:hypothetical protein [Fulvivirga lutimaris]|uniref:hypothetical protein n=1 Tax=Fulvivirga lutimaris TaxID=1819566 RepID=UPI0012BCD4D2|nr:hypothetical protein [Fulvivirga lutimaris]MTI38737.1 hypothetical protein [Fulvivirga lutimaris]
MTKLKVNINKPQPPLEVIHKYRDFGGLMQKYTKYYRTDGIRHMLYNDRKKLVYIVIIIVFILLMLFVDDVSF